MWIVRLALRRPYTVAVLAALLFIGAGLSIARMRVDIFPAIRIPVVLVVWNFPGLSAEEMERRVVLISERAFSTSVNGIARIESQSISGIGIIKVYFQPGSDIGSAIAQIGATSSTLLRTLPPGMQPPLILPYDASNVPVVRMTLRSDTVPEQIIADYALNFVRVRLFTIPGLATPAPFGGRQRQINVDLDLQRIAANGLSPQDVVQALQASNVILPAGLARLGGTEYDIRINGSPATVTDFNAIPVKVVNGATVYLGDVASVHDGYAVQQNIVRVDGRRAAYLAILKTANASTLAVVDATRDMLPLIRATAPRGIELRLDFDQSKFVRAVIASVVREGAIAAVLVSTMVLFFLGSWRSVIVVSTSIPLAICASIMGLFLNGNSLDVMTLGGLALAIGMLVDDATVEVENIERNRRLGKPIAVAVLDSAHQIATPAIAATLTICIVFAPVVLLTGPARYLFTALALAVVLAMLASYLLSRTLVPTLARLLLAHEEVHPEGTEAPPPKGVWGRFNHWRDRNFARFQASYGRALDGALVRRWLVLLFAAAMMAIAVPLATLVGMDFFPRVDAGILRLHVRARPGTRIENMEQIVDGIEQKIREIIPPGELETIQDNLGLPIFYNLAFVPTDNVGPQDAEITIALREGRHRPSIEYERRIRAAIPPAFPGVTLNFQAADIVSQVLNFGVSAPIDVQVEGTNLQQSHAIALRLAAEMRRIAGTVDVRIPQILDYPAFYTDVDRARAAQIGLAQRDVATSLLTSLSSSSLIAPSFFLNPENNVNYPVVVQTPIARIWSLDDVRTTPLTGNNPILESPPQSFVDQLVPPPPVSPYLGSVATFRRGSDYAVINHRTVQTVVDVMCGVDKRDLGGVTADVQRAIARLGPLPAGTRVHLLGQSSSMIESFRSLAGGLVLAVVLVYLLLVVLFQSWLDPFIILTAVPGGLVGVLWMLAITRTTINVESLMGSIMVIGIAASNSILLVSFANDLREEHPIDATHAAAEAGRTRLRPVLMTALAMILGMLPMALGLGEGGEQNAPLGRAVIGGLLGATFVTLFVVPVLYSLLRRKPPRRAALEAKYRAETQG